MMCAGYGSGMEARGLIDTDASGSFRSRVQLDVQPGKQDVTLVGPSNEPRDLPLPADGAHQPRNRMRAVLGTGTRGRTMMRGRADVGQRADIRRTR